MTENKKAKEKKRRFVPTALSDEPKLEAVGNREIIVEGCKGISEYSESLIKLNTGSLSMGFKGAEMLIQSFDNSVVVIKGIITEIYFVT